METGYARLEERYTYQDSAHKRTTDLPWFLLMAGCLVVYVLLYLAELGSGGLGRLKAYDSAGNMCGVGERENYPYVFYLDPEVDLRYSVCVKECPTVTEFECSPNTWVSACDYHYQNTTCSDIATAYYQSGVLLNTVCYPGDSSDPPATIWDLIALATTHSLLGILPLALCCLFFLLVRHLVSLVLWLFFATGSLLLCYLSYELMTTETIVKGYPVSTYVGYLLIIVSVGCLIGAFLLRERLHLAGTVVKLAVEFLFSQLLTFILGLFAYFTFFATIIFGLGLAYMTYSKGEVIDNDPHVLPVMLLSTAERGLFAFEVVVFIWCFLFWDLFYRMIVSNAVIKWYFRKDAVVPFVQVLASGFTTLRYHLGQLAFLSLLQALTLPICFALMQLEDLPAVLSDVCEVLKAVFFVLTMGLMILGKFTLANLAYTDNSLCEGLRSTYMLIVKNPLKTVMYESARLLVALMAYLVIGLCSLYLSSVLFDQPIDSSFSSLYNDLLYVSTIGITVGVFSAIADSVLICVLQDDEDIQSRRSKVKAAERQDTIAYLFKE